MFERSRRRSVRKNCDNVRNVRADTVFRGRIVENPMKCVEQFLFAHSLRFAVGEHGSLREKHSVRKYFGDTEHSLGIRTPGRYGKSGMLQASTLAEGSRMSIAELEVYAAE